ncbi:hypothetical protein DXU06_22285 [Bradyrhizobium elkanii]|jgi:hypothetical protein
MKFGFGVSFEFLQHAVDFEIQKVAQGSFLKNMPFPYSGLAVTAEIPSGSIKVRIAGGSTEFTVDAEIRIAIHIDGDRNAFLAEDVITYTNGKATVVPNPNGTRLQYSAGAHGKFTVTLGPNPANLDALLTQIGMVDSNGNPDVNQFNLLRTGALYTNFRTFFVFLVNSLPFPDLLGSLASFKPLQPLLVGSTSSHFIVYSENVELPGGLCPKGGSALHELSWTQRDNKTGTASFSQDNVAKGKVADDILKSQTPNKDVKILNGNAFLYYFPRKVLFDYTFGKLKPSVTFSDSGTFCGISWYFALTAALKGVTVSFTAVSPTEGRIVVDVPFQAFGQAGASITVGCVDYTRASLGGPVELILRINPVER